MPLSWSMNSGWQQAIALAARAHRHQLRKDGATPYVAHCFRVTMIIRHIFGFDDEATLTAAVLHDTIEDTTVDYDDIAGAFGDEVASLVAAMTKNMALPEATREQRYDEQLAAADWRARLIKLADVYDNVQEAQGAQRVKAIDKARRALALAEADASTHPPAATATDAVRSLLAAST